MISVSLFDLRSIFFNGDEIILLENEYPSNVYPWRHLEKKGVKLLTASMERSPEAFLKVLKQLITAKTRAISLSAVNWCTGMPLPLEQVGKSDYPTGIVVCEKPGVESDVIMTHLKKNKIVAAERLGWVRFSPHVYISPEQIDNVVRVLAKI